MLKKILIFLLLLLICPFHIVAQDTSELENKIKEYETEINRLGKEKDTYGNQIKIIDSQINLAQLKINQTENEIKTLESEIQKLAVQIGELDISLNQLTTVFIQQINQNYRLLKQGPPIGFIIFNDFNGFLQQKKYVTTLQKNSQDTILKMEITRTNYDQQKTQKEQKQIELESLQKKLADQKKNLDRQKQSKKDLLEITKNSEANYQKLLAEALSQLRAFKSFSSNSGSSCLVSSPGNGSDGIFYSQRDPNWCRTTIGYSSETIGEVGCYISSIAMLMKKHGFTNISPRDIAVNSNNFFARTAYMLDFPQTLKNNNLNYQNKNYNQSVLDDYLKKGIPVIVQVRVVSKYGMHFVVIKSGSNGKYQMHDPWYGPDLEFNSYYSTSSILSLRIITKN